MMAPDPQCVAIANAKEKKGLSYAQIGQKSGITESRVIQICTSQDKPTEAEFKAIASALNITDNVSHTGVHATK